MTQIPPVCPYRVTDQRGVPVCNYHDSAPGDCSPGLCPLLERLRVEEEIRELREEKMEESRGHGRGGRGEP
jgi:hypothetical protein